jgi:starch synthase
VFKEYSPASLLYTINYAVKVYHDKEIWKKLVDRAMKLNFSWEAVAENYNKLYYKLVN